MGIFGEKPWLHVWPEGVPQHIDYPEVPLFGLLSGKAGEYPDSIAFNCGESALTYDGCSPCAEKLISFCEQRLAPYKKVREVEFVKEIPKTPVGKILRRVLRDKDCGK